jgi:hypothetical protein
LIGFEGSLPSFPFTLYYNESLRVMHGFLRLAPDVHQMFFEMFYCQQLAAHSLCKIKPWYSSYQEFKGGEAGSGIGPGVVYELSHGQERGPVVLLEIAVDSEVLLQPLVGTFQLSVHLRVIRGADILRDVQLFAEFGGKI